MKSIKIEKISLGLFLLFAFCFTALKVSAEAAEEQNWTRYQNSETNNGVTDRPGPTDAEHTIALWDVSMEAAATTPPLIVDNKIYTASGYYVYCFDKTTGEKLGQSDKLTGYVGHALHPMVYAEGKLFVMTSKGGTMIEALSLSDANNPKSIWASTPQQGTGYTPLTYHYNKTQNKGYLYTGTSNGDDKGVYFCVSADNGNVIWSMEDENGFYWDGAYATDNYVAFASENVIGGDSEAEGSVLYTVNPVTGKVIDKVTDLKGSIRNTVVFDNGYLYVGTVAGRLYRIKVNSNGELGQYSGTNDENFSYIDVDGRIKATMLIYNKRLYAGVEGKTEGTSCYKVIDCSKAFSEFSIADSVWVENEPKGAPILSTAEDDILYITIGSNTNSGILDKDSTDCDVPSFEWVLSGENYGDNNTGAFVEYGIQNKSGEKVKEGIISNGTILSYDFTSGKISTFATGIRNIEGLDFNNEGKIIAIVGGMEDEGSRAVKDDKDYIYEIKENAWYGWPDYSGGDSITSPKFSDGTNILEPVISNPPTKTPYGPIYQHYNLSSLKGLAVDREGNILGQDVIVFADNKENYLYSLGKNNVANKIVDLGDNSKVEVIRCYKDGIYVLDSKVGVLYKLESTGNKTIFKLPIIIWGFIIVFIVALIIAEVLKYNKKYKKN